MTSLVQPIIRNTRHISHLKFGKFSNRSVLHEGIFQWFLRILDRHFFVFGIFTPVGVHSINEGGFHAKREIPCLTQFSIQYVQGGVL